MVIQSIEVLTVKNNSYSI